MEKGSRIMYLPWVQGVPVGRCCLVHMCRSEEGLDTWPRLSAKERKESEGHKGSRS